MQEAHQLCDLGLVLLRQIAGRLTRGKPLEPGRFPGQVVLPRLCFRPNMEQSEHRWRACCIDFVWVVVPNCTDIAAAWHPGCPRPFPLSLPA